MKVDALLRGLLPKDDKFFRYFEQDIQNLRTASETFLQIMSSAIPKEERANKIHALEELEHRGDEITHQIFSELGQSFITPLDREDIHLLASKLDDILDYVQGSGSRILLYRVDEIPPEMTRLAEIIFAQVEQLQGAVGLLRDLGNIEVAREILVRIHSLENEADDLFEQSIANLFETCKDPIRLIKLKELFVSLETATDKCEDAANVIEGIMVKNA